MKLSDKKLRNSLLLNLDTSKKVQLIDKYLIVKNGKHFTVTEMSGTQEMYICTL